MTRILILGAAPLPFEPQRRQYAANLRTWHFTRPLLDAGHQIRLIGGRLPKTYPEGADPISLTHRDGLEYYSLSGELFHDQGYIQQLADEFDPEAILGINTHPSARVVLIDTERPIWCDLNGWIMAEAQTKSYVYDDDRYLSHFWNMEREVLDRADVISTVSEAQAHATVGELALRGRLGRKCFGYNFVHTIPNAISEVDYQHSRNVFRGSLVDKQAFVVLWAGGYNTWTHVDLLYEALTTAMAEVPHLVFVSTGGAIEGHDEITFESFRQRAAASIYADRFHFAGWVPTEDVPSYYFESDLGINVDSFNYETVFGARNRLNDMMKVGLPVLTTTGTEISHVIARRELGLTCATGDAAGFAERLIWAARHPQELATMAEAGREFVHFEFSYERTTEPVRTWAEKPWRAPDHGERIEFGNINFFSQPEPVRTVAVTDWEDDGEVPEISRRRVCAVIPHHQDAEMLGRCLESLLASAAVDLEVVVVENDCQEELPKIAVDSSQVHAIRSEVSLGFSAANNLGVAWAREHLEAPDFYYFVNNDTESSTTALARLIAALEARPEAAMAGPRLLILNAEDHYNSLGINVTEDGWGWDEAIGLKVTEYGSKPALRTVLTVTGAALLIDAAVFHKVEGWTEIYDYYFEDIDLGIKVWKAHRQVINVPEATVRHRISATMTDGSQRKNFLFWRNRLFLAIIHWPFGLLLKTLRRAIFLELLAPGRTDRPALRQALAETMERLPKLWRLRRQGRGNSGWRGFLEPPGSVPVITLPQIRTAEPIPAPSPAPAPARVAKKVTTVTPEAIKAHPDLPDPDQLESGSGARHLVEYLTRTVAETRAELTASKQRADRLGNEYTEAMRVLGQIHSSRMWRLWQRYVAARSWFLKPFLFLRKS